MKSAWLKLVEDSEAYHELLDFTNSSGDNIAHRLGMSARVAIEIRELVKKEMNKHIEVVQLDKSSKRFSKELVRTWREGKQ